MAAFPLISLREGRGGESSLRWWRNVDIRKLTANTAKYALYLRGFKNAPIENIHVAMRIERVEKADVIENVKRSCPAQCTHPNGKLV